VEDLHGDDLPGAGTFVERGLIHLSDAAAAEDCWGAERQLCGPVNAEGSGEGCVCVFEGVWRRVVLQFLESGAEELAEEIGAGAGPLEELGDGGAGRLHGPDGVVQPEGVEGGGEGGEGVG